MLSNSQLFGRLERSIRAIKMERRLWFSMIVVLELLLFHSANAQTSLTIDSLKYQVTDASHPTELDSNAWLTTTLPYNFRTEHPAESTVWFEYSFSAFEVGSSENTAPNVSVYFPKSIQNVAIYLNGDFLGDGGRFNSPIARNWNRPLLFSFPSSLLKQNNKLVIRVSARKFGWGYLAPFQIGTGQQLLQDYERRVFWQVDLMRLTSWSMVAFGLAIACLWINRRQETQLGILSLAMFAHAMNSFNYHVRDIPFPDVLWEFLTNVSLGWFGVLLILFVHRHIGIYRKKTEWLFIGTGMLATIAALIVPTEKFYDVTQTWISLILLACIYPILLYLVDFYKNRKYTSAIFSIIGITMIASGVHDMQMQLGLIPHAQHYLPYCFFVLLVLYGGVLIRRFVVAMNDVEELNAHMEGIVQEKKNELEHSYDKLFQLEKERLLFQERERLTQDMHDGIGGTLVTTLAMAESEPHASRQITDALRHALADLRLTLISLEPNETLMGSLAMLKSRIGPTFRHGEISLDWNINDIPPLEGEGPTLNLNVMRIIQEATTNIIKHAQATRVEVSSHSEDAFFVISISDNGIGLNPDKVSTQDSSHKGLIHMNKRASKMGGHCCIESTNLGTSIRLFLPINSNKHPSKSISPT